MQTEDINRLCSSRLYCPNCDIFGAIIPEEDGGFVCLSCQKIWSNFNYIINDLMEEKYVSE